MGKDWNGAQYEDDNREGMKLVINKDEQGDFYISVIPADSIFGECVRLTASGGAASRCPKLRQAIFDVWEALCEMPEERKTDAERRV